MAAAVTAASHNMRTGFRGCSRLLSACTSGLSSAQAQVLLAFSWYSVQSYCVFSVPWGIISNEQFSAESSVVPFPPEVVLPPFAPFPSLHRLSCLWKNIRISPHRSWLQGCCACLMHGARTGLAAFSWRDILPHPSEWGVPGCVKITAFSWTLLGPIYMGETIFA